NRMRKRSGEPHLLFDGRGLADCNDAALALLGAGERSGVLGLPLAGLVCASDPTGSIDLEEAIAGARREGVRRIEARARRIDGQTVPVEMTITPIRLAGNEALLVAWHDIADRQRYEQELRRARDEAQSAVHAKASFLAMMSHELRTPMTGVIGMSELLADTRLDDEQRRLVSVLNNSAHSLLTVVNDVLDFSKIEAGKLALESIDFDPVAVVREVIDLLSSAASGRGNLLEQQAPDQTGLRVTGDPTRLRQILFNLVGNAIKFTERGRITVSVEAQAAAPESLRLAFEVRDTGIGIPPEVLPTLFAPFQQADSSTTRRFGGTGLGLAICRHLVTAMHGEIGVTSVPGEGSCFAFSIELPRAAEAPAGHRTAAPVSESGAGIGLDILLAEDNPTNQLLLATRLRRAGHRVEVVENGALAVERVQEHDFDIVLMDMQMPVLDGSGATRAIRALDGEKGQVPVLALTADALPEFRSRYMDSGLNDYLTKPVDWKALESALVRHARAPRAPAPGTERQAEIAASDNTAARAQPTPAASAIDPAAVVAEDSERVAMMRADLGEETFVEILDIFWEKSATDLSDLALALAKGDAASARAAAHSMKGALGGMGFEAAARIADRLQHGKPDMVADELAALRAVLALMRESYDTRADQTSV
ncbi:MAG TPA: ATP-binding protein, partial [Burkholderiaceae bacterium]|nr:ATP-binding protein [Burkholderiaceae bacterium]